MEKKIQNVSDFRLIPKPKSTIKVIHLEESKTEGAKFTQPCHGPMMWNMQVNNPKTRAIRVSDLVENKDFMG
jgi:hypothetical protein